MADEQAHMRFVPLRAQMQSHNADTLGRTCQHQAQLIKSLQEELARLREAEAARRREPHGSSPPARPPPAAPAQQPPPGGPGVGAAVAPTASLDAKLAEVRAQHGAEVLAMSTEIKSLRHRLVQVSAAATAVEHAPHASPPPGALARPPWVPPSAITAGLGAGAAAAGEQLRHVPAGRLGVHVVAEVAPHGSRGAATIVGTAHAKGGGWDAVEASRATSRQSDQQLGLTLPRLLAGGGGAPALPRLPV